jgi:hypothetical protein
MSYEPREYDENYVQDDYGADAYEADRAVARSRVSAPAVLLIIVGILNLLSAGFLLFRGAQVALTPIEDFKEQQEQSKKIMQQMFPGMEQPPQTPEELKMQTVAGSLGSGVVGAILALLTLFGGIRMKGLHSYGLAVVGAIIAMIPCLSPSACCLLGEIAGIWAVAVLLNQDVKSAFR